MDSLNQVCATLLDNADLDVDLNRQTAIIRLCFTVGGSLEKVTFECSQFHSFKIVKVPDDTDCLFVAKTQVTLIENTVDIERWLSSEGWSWGDTPLPERLYRIEVLGEVEITILCQKFDWYLKKTSGHELLISDE